MNAARHRAAAAALAAVLLGAGPAAAFVGNDEVRPIFRGTWIATVGPASGVPFQGEWSAQTTLASRPDEVQGSWSLRGQNGEIAMKGTWSARRAKRGMKGKWSARMPNGGVLSGSFEVDARSFPPGFKGKTFQDLLATTQTARIAGTWRTGGARGHWWLKAPD